MYSAFDHWAYLSHMLTVISMFSPCTQWVFGPLSPVSRTSAPRTSATPSQNQSRRTRRAQATKRFLAQVARRLHSVFSCPDSVMFYFVLFSMPVSCPQRLFHVCDVYHGFDFVSFFYSTHLAFFRNFFFPPVSPSFLRRLRSSVR